ncbi:MAG: DEAD/DEAH box helicase [Planctomycetota bacterium]
MPSRSTPENTVDIGRFADRLVAHRVIPSRPARYGEFPKELRPELQDAIQSFGIEKLYSHQSEMAERALLGDNVVITTGTASGKSLGYLIPIIQRILERPESRAILLFPTKALAQDQLRGVLEIVAPLGKMRVQAGVYDGDTPPVERRRIRESCNLILTNPDMLNTAYLPNHGRRGFSHLFRNVDFVVVDEMHSYRGAFGSHFANLMRRFRRICQHYHSNPQFLCSSATIANPVELAEKLFDLPFHLVEEDGSPSAGKDVHFWQPPIVDHDFRRGVVQEMSDFLPELIHQRLRTIAFCRSRKETEVVLKETRDALMDVDGGHNEAHLIAGYRAGYTPVERRAVEKKLMDGDLIGVVSTNALELGVDIGALEVVVQGGFPGTRASFWQQIGRAGRRQSRAQAFVILRMTPMDQYLALDPDWLINKSAEHAVVDRDNLTIQLAHIRSAAAELPLTLDDAALFPDLGETIPLLVEAGELNQSYGTFQWTGNAHPAGDFSLRNVDRERFKIVNRESGDTLSEMNRIQTFHEAHWRAVYLHDGMQYLVEELDLVGHQVLVRPVEQNFYTEPDIRIATQVLNTQDQRELGRTKVWFGDVKVDDTTIGYKMLQFHNHQNLGYESLPSKLTVELETEGTWIAVPQNVAQVLGDEGDDYLRGVLHGIVSCARMQTMAEASDLNATSFHYSEEETGRTLTALVLYDSHPGGLGFAARSFDEIEAILEAASKLVMGCACKSGCPACVGDYHLDRKLVAWALSNLIAESAPPKGRRVRPQPLRQSVISRQSFDQLASVWSEFVLGLPRGGEAGVDFLRQIETVRTHGARLILEVQSPGVISWIRDEATKSRLENLIAHYVNTPEGFSIDAELQEGADASADFRSRKLRRRLEDLHADNESEELGP